MQRGGRRRRVWAAADRGAALEGIGLTQPYSDAFIDHVRHPRNVGAVEDPDGEATVRDRACGDLLQLTLRIRDDRIEGARFRVFGCGAAVAGGSMLTVMLRGLSVADAMAMGEEDVARALDGLPGHRMHSSLLARQAVAEALEDYRRRMGGGRPGSQASPEGRTENEDDEG